MNPHLWMCLTARWMRSSLRYFHKGRQRCWFPKNLLTLWLQSLPRQRCRRPHRAIDSDRRHFLEYSSDRWHSWTVTDRQCLRVTFRLANRWIGVCVETHLRSWRTTYAIIAEFEMEYTESFWRQSLEGINISSLRQLMIDNKSIPKAISNESTEAVVVVTDSVDLMLIVSSCLTAISGALDAIDDKVNKELTFLFKEDSTLIFWLPLCGTELLLLLIWVWNSTFWRDIWSEAVFIICSSLINSFSRTSISMGRKTSKRSRILRRRLKSKQIFNYCHHYWSGGYLWNGLKSVDNWSLDFLQMADPLPIRRPLTMANRGIAIMAFGWQSSMSSCDISLLFRALESVSLKSTTNSLCFSISSALLIGSIAFTYSYSKVENSWSKCSSLQIISNDRFPLNRGQRCEELKANLIEQTFHPNRCNNSSDRVSTDPKWRSIVWPLVWEERTRFRDSLC